MKCPPSPAQRQYGRMTSRRLETACDSTTASTLRVSDRFDIGKPLRLYSLDNRTPLDKCLLFSARMLQNDPKHSSRSGVLLCSSLNPDAMISRQDGINPMARRSQSLSSACPWPACPGCMLRVTRNRSLRPREKAGRLAEHNRSSPGFD
jgi:hypothetical protein